MSNKNPLSALPPSIDDVEKQIYKAIEVCNKFKPTTRDNLLKYEVYGSVLNIWVKHDDEKFPKRFRKTFIRN